MRITLDLLFRHFKQLKDLAGASDEPDIFKNQLNAAAWRLLYEGSATMGALADPDQARSVLATLRSDDVSHFLLKPAVCVFTDYLKR